MKGMKEMKKKGFLIGFIIFCLILSAGYGVGVYFVNYALSPVSDSDQRDIDEDERINVLEGAQKQIALNKQTEGKKAEAFEKTTKPMIVSANDSIALKGKYLMQKENQHIWTILIHGYKSNYSNMMSYGAAYYEKGYNVVLPDNRAHGKSEGELIGMGWLDKDDIACWVDWIVKKDPQAKIILHGVSMGGATVMMCAGDQLEHVVGYVEDCGYTSVWDIFASELEKRFHLPTFPILDISNLVARLKAGYDFKEASSIEQLKKNDKPILFIHGGKDDFVPTEMVYEVYKATNAPKDLYLVEEAGHAEAKDYNPQTYWDKVFQFIDQKIEINN
ncbi:MAG: alpha/beta hydrolase [Coprobacillus cateniformis]|nr:alpha/beta hydrolase [Coprobacillus cateniformis]